MPLLSVPSAGHRCGCPRNEKKLAITVFSFPPDKGNVGTAAYLDVFGGSIHRVMQEMKAKGYDVQDLPSTPRALLEAVINDADAMQGSPELSIAHRMSVGEYERLTPIPSGWKRTGASLPAASATARTWCSDAISATSSSVFNTFGYEGDPIRLLYSHSASPHHGFAAYYTYLQKIWKADAVLHFGTHGSSSSCPASRWA